MSNYVYTDNNNAISVGKLIQGVDGPQGHTGRGGSAGAAGVAGTQGEKGPDNLRKTDICFSGVSSAYATIPAGKITLIGHVIFNNLAALSTVKVIAGAHNSGGVSKGSLWLANHSTEDSNRVMVAEKHFEVSGHGLPKDFRIHDLTIDPSAWPDNEDVLGVWAFIDYTKESINSTLTSLTTFNSAEEAIAFKEKLAIASSTDKKYLYDTMKKSYNIGTQAIVEEEKLQLQDDLVAEKELQAKKDLALQTTENETAIIEGRRPRSVSKQPEIAFVPQLHVAYLELS